MGQGGPGPQVPGVPGGGEGVPGQGRPFPANEAYGGQPAGGDWELSPPGAAEQRVGAPQVPAGVPEGHPGQPVQPPGGPAPQGPGAPGAPEFAPQQGGAPAPQGGGAWTALIGPDREYFAAMMQRSGPEAASLNLPAYSPEQQLPLTGPQVTIGRRRASTGEAPDIDLGRPPEDPGVSHQHAVLVQQPDGSWSVVDQDSTNGTTLNGAEDPIQPYVPVPLKEGDRVHVGAWTTITLTRR
ncbi:FHA domain-containing protein [Streptomyces diacarni]